MNRFFLSRPVILDNIMIIEDKEQVHHIRRVLRLKPKEPVVVFDEEGNEYDCLISKLEEKVTLEVKDKRVSKKLNARTSLTIACAIPKKAKFDDIVDKLTQLGVDRIIPLITERVVVKLDRKKEEARLNRWRKIATSAAQQSQRRNIPEISVVKTFKELLSLSSEFDLKLIPTLAGLRKPIQEAIGDGSIFSKQQGERNRTVSVLVLIGPEGDFSDEEVRLAKKMGLIPVTLGDLVLRVDTAAIAVTSLIRFYAYR